MILLAKDLPLIKAWKKGDINPLLNKALKSNDLEAIAILGSYKMTKSKHYIEAFFRYCGFKNMALWEMI